MCWRCDKADEVGAWIDPKDCLDYERNLYNETREYEDFDPQYGDD